MEKNAIGIDVGGTAVKIGIVSYGGEILDKWSIKTRTGNNGKNILPDIAESIKNKIADNDMSLRDMAGAGIGLPGLVDADGMTHDSANLGWDEPFNIEDELSELLDGIKVKSGNDANVAALGEAWRGAGQDAADMVMVTLGTGIGGGVIQNGRIVCGAHGSAGEIGHICVNPYEKDRCKCGRYGCLEQYASATGIKRLAETMLGVKDISVKELWNDISKGDEMSVSVAEKFGDYLGFGLAAVAGVLDPEIFVIGGGVSMAGDIILSYIRNGYKKYAFRSLSDTPIVRAALGNDAGMLGAAGLVLSH